MFFRVQTPCYQKNKKVKMFGWLVLRPFIEMLILFRKTFLDSMTCFADESIFVLFLFLIVC